MGTEVVQNKKPEGNTNNNELTNDAATHTKSHEQNSNNKTVTTTNETLRNTNDLVEQLTPTQTQQQVTTETEVAPNFPSQHEYAVEEIIQEIHLPIASPPPQVITIPATHDQQQQQQSTTTAAVVTTAAKKVRRAFSMPRNPFRWSRKFKTENHYTGNGGVVGSGSGLSNSALTSCVGGGRGRTGSIISLNSYEAISKNTNGIGGKIEANLVNMENYKNAAKNNVQSGAGVNGGSNAGSNCASGNNNHNQKRVLRRSSFRKFLNRIAHQFSNSINVGGSNATTASSTTTSKSNFIDIIPYYTGCWRRKEANKQAAAGNTLTQATPTTTTATLTTRTRNALTNERVPPINGYQWPADQTPGVMGLKNHGNTCFMNAVLQCLSHTDILAEYFVLDQYKVDLKRRNKINSRKFGTKGELTEQLANVLKALWTCKNESDHSTSFKAVVERYGSQFRSSTQHDAQEFLFWLLDKVHEDLNTATKRRYKSVKNTYGRPDEVIAAETLANHIRCNNSFVQAVFQAQFRSSLTCPRCKKQSNTFDPFHCISVQLPQLTQQIIFVTVVYSRPQQPQQVKYGLTVPAGSPIIALREQLQIDTGIPSERLVLVDLGPEGFTRVFYDSQPVVTLNGNETIYCIEMPETQIPTALEKNVIASAPATMTSSESAEASSKTAITSTHATDLLLLVANVRKQKVTSNDGSTEETSAEGADAGVSSKISNSGSKTKFERFGAPFSMQVPRDCSYTELQKKLLREMSAILKPEVFSYTTPLNEMFRIRLQDPSADPDTFIEQVEHPLLTEMIDLALSVLSAESGPAHVKLLLEWVEPDQYFQQLTNTIVEHESVARLRDNKPNETAALTLEQCLEHYTKAETLSAEDAWRCPHCQQYLPVVKTLGLWSLPDILVVHFKRFRQHHGKSTNAAKLTTMVKFPLTAFDMAPHLARGANGETPATTADAYRPSPWRKTRPGDSRSSTLSSRADNKETRYDLYAVCYHQGDTLETGHYTAACKNPYDRQWYKFDDQRVAKVPSDAIPDEIINNEAYMLFYQRRTVEAIECSGSSSNSGDHWISRIAPPPPTITATTTASSADSQSKEKLDEKAHVEQHHAIEKLPEKAESKPVDVPKITDDPVKVLGTSPVRETLATANAESVKLTPLNIDELNYADEDESLLAVSNKNLLNAVPVEKHNVQQIASNEIFAMDEDELESTITTSPTPIKPFAAKEILIQPQPNTAVPATISTPSPTPKMNGYHINDVPIDSTGSVVSEQNATATDSPKSPNSRASSTSVSSSATSLSSRSSPHSLAASTYGATTLQTKFNSYAITNNNTNSNSVRQKETVYTNMTSRVNTTFKSNSSTIIAAASAAARSHEFQPIRTPQQIQQHHHWHGSRSSVSAVENASQHSAVAAHTHGLNLRHSFSTSSNYKFRECSDTLSSLLRNSANTCSKDTLLFIDQQNHPSLMEDDDDNFMGSRSLWISPVTPHKLITVSPKN